MDKNSRTAKSIKNTYIAMCFNLLNILAQFISRKLFLDYLGADTIGLNITVQNILQFLNLAELGISSAVSFTLYRPLRENNTIEINEIITLQGLLYRRIAYIIMGLSVILLLFFPIIFEKIKLPLWYAYAAYCVMLTGSLLSYFINYKQIALSASQEEYKIVCTFQSSKLCMVILQCFAVYFLPYPYIWWLVIQLIFSVIGSYFLNYITIKTFPFLTNVKTSFSTLKKKYSDFTRKIRQVFFHKIGGFVLGQSAPLLIYAFTSLNDVALYGNYLLITSGVMYVVNSVFSSVNAGIGNLVAENNPKRIKIVFQELFLVRFFLSSSILYSIVMLTPSFISIWIGQEYILPFSSLLLMSLIMYIGMIRWAIDSFIYAYGLFGDVYSPLAEATINIVCSLLLGRILGLNGVLLGSFISLVIVICIWKPFYLFHMKMPTIGFVYVKMYLKAIVVFIIASILPYLIYHIGPNYIISDGIKFIITGMYVCLTFCIIAFFLMYIIFEPFRSFTKRFHI